MKEGFRSFTPEIDHKKGVELFSTVRDTPYALGFDGNTEGLLSESKGGCTRKHLYMIPRLQSLGYKVAIGISEFDWRDLPIPTEILTLLKQPIQHHLFLYVGKDTPNMEVDATWDKGMEKVGFQVLDWDGISPTGLTVKSWVKKMNQLHSMMLLTSG